MSKMGIEDYCLVILDEQDKKIRHFVVSKPWVLPRRGEEFDIVTPQDVAGKYIVVNISHRLDETIDGEEYEACSEFIRVFVKPKRIE